MADNTTLNPGAAGDTIRDKDRAGVKTQIVALDLAPGGAETLMNGVMPVSDNAGSLTVDAPVGTPVFVRLSDGSSAIATLPVSLALLPGTAADGAASLPAVQPVIAGWDGTNVQAIATDSSGIVQVDVVGDAATQAGAAARTADFDSGAGTVTTVMNGIALPASGGPVVGGTTANPIKTDPTGTTTQPVSDAGGSLTVDNAGTFAVQPTANASVNLNQVVGTAVDVNSGNKSAGTQRVTLATDQVQLTNALKVDGSAVTQPVSGTVTATGPLTDAQLRATVVPVQDVGNVAHDGADSGNPVKIGARAISADITAVTANDRTDALATLLGKGLMMPYCLPGATLQGSGNKTDTSDLALIAAQGAGIRIYVTHITITNAHATVGTKVVLKSAATIIWRGYADALGGGVCTALPVPLRLTANEALNGAAITTGADVDFTVVGYAAAE